MTIEKPGWNPEKRADHKYLQLLADKHGIKVDPQTPNQGNLPEAMADYNANKPLNPSAVALVLYGYLESWYFL